MKIMNIQIDSRYGAPLFGIASNYTETSPYIEELCYSREEADRDLEWFKASDPTLNFEIVCLNCEVVK